MIATPFLALKLFFTRPRLFALGVFPGLFTFAGSCALVYALWREFLQDAQLALALPVMMLAFLLGWLMLGKLALIPVEDAIVDECQRALWNEVRLPAPPFSGRRVAREAFYSLVLAVVAPLLLVLTFLPLLAPFQFVLAGWLSAYGFLATIYARRVESARGRITLFFAHPISNFLLGAGLNLLLFVPVLNVFLLGYGQVLTALLYFRREARLTR